jgi:hypothetical protein
MKPFTFNRKYKVFEEDVLDLSVINGEVPKPDAQVDIEVALKEYERDLNSAISLASLAHPTSAR